MFSIDFVSPSIDFTANSFDIYGNAYAGIQKYPAFTGASSNPLNPKLENNSSSIGKSGNPLRLNNVPLRNSAESAYILEDSDKETPDGIIIASGSEVNLAVSAKAELKNAGIDVRVVSMPSMDVFEKQSEEYKESVLPKSVRKRVAVEALPDFGWYRYVGLDGKVICMKTFGASGPANQLFEHFGFTVENVVNTVKSLF